MCTGGACLCIVSSYVLHYPLHQQLRRGTMAAMACLHWCNGAHIASWAICSLKEVAIPIPHQASCSVS